MFNHYVCNCPIKAQLFKTAPPSRKYNTLLRLDHYYYSKFELIFFFLKSGFSDWQFFLPVGFRGVNEMCLL